METDYFLNFLVLSGQKRKRETPAKNDAFRLSSAYATATDKV